MELIQSSTMHGFIQDFLSEGENHIAITSGNILKHVRLLLVSQTSETKFATKMINFMKYSGGGHIQSGKGGGGGIPWFPTL